MAQDNEAERRERLKEICGEACRTERANRSGGLLAPSASVAVWIHTRRCLLRELRVIDQCLQAFGDSVRRIWCAFHDFAAGSALQKRQNRGLALQDFVSHAVELFASGLVCPVRLVAQRTARQPHSKR